MVRKRFKKKGMAMLLAAALLALVMMAVTAYIDYTTAAVRIARNFNHESRAEGLAESGYYKSMQAIWLNFKVNQSLAELDTLTAGASPSNPKQAIAGSVPDVGSYSAGVIGASTPANDAYSRVVTFRSVGWIDANNNGIPDAGEPVKTLDYTVRFSLQRSSVFDYAHFVNNYGWISGFSSSSMIVNGDWRVNGDWEILNGGATVNGSVIGAANDKLLPPALGQVMNNPTKWDDATYASKKASSQWGSRMRPVYDPGTMGDLSSTTLSNYRDELFESTGSVLNGRAFGATLQDSDGTEAWQENSIIHSHAVLDTNPTTELPVPDLNNFGSPSDPPNVSGQQYARSKAYTDPLSTFLDGTPNPNSATNPGSQQEMIGTSPNPNYTGAFVDVWDSTVNDYKRVSTNGIVTSSVMLVGTDAHPIRIHGPVTVAGDVGIAGTVSGTGTLYAARNVQIAASIKYANPPSFSGDLAGQEITNQKADALGLAAQGSVIMGDPSKITGDALAHMMPPFTKARTDENGNVIPAFDASAIDSYGIPAYQSLLQNDPNYSAAFATAVSGDVAQIDAFIYTNNVFGGTAGWGYNGLTINGCVCCKDEAVAAYSTPVTINYDERIRDRGDGHPLIDVSLPRGPSVTTTSYQDRGFTAAY